MSSKRCVCAVCTRLLFFSFSKPQIDERERERLAKEQADLAARAVVGRLPNQTARLSMQKMSLVRGTNVLPPVGELQSSGNGSSAQTGGNTAFFNNLMSDKSKPVKSDVLDVNLNDPALEEKYKFLKTFVYSKN